MKLEDMRLKKAKKFKSLMHNIYCQNILKEQLKKNPKSLITQHALNKVNEDIEHEKLVIKYLNKKLIQQAQEE